MPEPPDTASPPEYKLYRTRPKLLQRGSRDGDSLLDDLRGAPPGAPPRRRRRLTVGRVVKWLVLALVGWIVLSVALFLISAALQQDQVSSGAEAQLDGGGVGLTSPQTTLILGSDRRTEETQEPGGSTSGPSRSDSILLMRFGGGHRAKLSIPRDTVVDIPGHGRDKINAAYALGGAALTIQTVKQYLGIDVDHVFEVNFANFPALIDAMGGVDYTGGCVVSRINGGFKNGGYAAPQARDDAHRRPPSTRPGPHAQERVQQARGRPHPRAAPAEDPGRHEGPAVLDRRLRPPAGHLLERAEVRRVGHGRPAADGLRARPRAQR